MSESPFPALDRRGFLRLTGAAGALGMAGPLIAACGSSGSSSKPIKHGIQIGEYVPGPQPVSGGRRGGTVKVVWNDAPFSFDPAVGNTLIDWDCITNLVFFGGLLTYDKQFGGPVPNIAAAMPTITNNGTTLTFKLRKDVKFHNGRTIVAADFKYAWERVLDPKLASWGSSYLSSIVGANEMINGKAKSLAGVQAVDDTTLVVQLTQPDFTILNVMSLPMTAPVPSEAVHAMGNTQFGKTPVGYGPFKITSYDSVNQSATFERFQDYMYPGLPYLDSVTYQWGIDAQVQMIKLEQGDADIVGPGVPSGSAGQVLANPSLRPLARSLPSPGNYWLTMYDSNVPAFKNQQVRQAMNWAVDRIALNRVIYGSSTPWGAPFPEHLAGFTPTFTPYGYDVTKAKQLLSQAGYGKGFDVTLSVSTTDPFPAIAQFVQQAYKAINVNVKLTQMNSNALYSLETATQAGHGHLQMSTDTWYMIQPTPADEVTALYTTKASSNENGYSNPQVDRLASQALRTFNDTARNQIYAQIQQIVGQDAPYVFLSSTQWLAGVSQRIQNYHYRGETYSYYDRMWV